MARPRRPCDTAVPMKPVRLLLVDDNTDFLASANAHLCTRPELHLVGAARSGAEALELSARHPVDLVLLDLNMRGMDGLTTTRQLKTRPGAPKIIIVTLHDAPEYRRLALAAGADGFVGKAEFTTALLPLIGTLFGDATVQPSPSLEQTTLPPPAPPLS